MKKIIWTIVIVGVVVLLVVWLRGAPEAKTPQPSAETPTVPTPAPITSNKNQPKAGQPRAETTKDGMTIEILTEGTGPAITTGQTAEVDYVGRLTNGTVFDASAKHGSTFSFPLGAGQVIKGWDEGVVGMKVGETRRLTIPPALAYGERGVGGVIPPNATLIFEVTLKSIK